MRRLLSNKLPIITGSSSNYQVYLQEIYYICKRSMDNKWFVGILSGVLSLSWATSAMPVYGTHLQSSVRGASPEFDQLHSSATYCVVTNIQRGQLALRTSPNGNARAGLDNGMTVQYIRQQGIWYYVRVVMINNNNMRLLGLQGWVNSNYLYCGPDVDGPDV